MTVDMSPKAVTARLQRLSQLRNLCLSLAAAGRRAGLAAADGKSPAGPERDDGSRAPRDRRVTDETGGGSAPHFDPTAIP